MKFTREALATGFLVLSVAAVADAQASTQCATSANPTTRAQQAHAYADELLHRWHIPGLQVAVGVDTVLVWNEALGVSDLEQSAPVTEHTRFSIGSVSKLITAAALMRAVERGRIDLDASIARYLPELPMPARSITPRQLAGHLGGIRHYNQVENSTLSPNYPRRYATATEALAVFINDSLVARPGTQYVYSSFGFNLLGAVLEGATHQRFLSYVQDAVLTPLMMYGTVADHTDSIVANRSRGYWRRSDSSAIVNFPPGVVNYKWPSGGFLSTASDLVHFALAHARPGFLSDSTRALMFTPQRLSNGTTTRVGIGWRIAVDGSGRTLVHHGGAGSGTRAFLLLYPGERVAVAMLANILAPFAEDEAQQFACFFITH